MRFLLYLIEQKLCWFQRFFLYLITATLLTSSRVPADICDDKAVFSCFFSVCAKPKLTPALMLISWRAEKSHTRRSGVTLRWVSCESAQRDCTPDGEHASGACHERKSREWSDEMARRESSSAGAHRTAQAFAGTESCECVFIPSHRIST